VRALLLSSLVLVVSCSRSQPTADPQGALRPDAGPAPVASASVAPAAAAIPAGATSCTAGAGPTCLRFATPDDAFKWVLAKKPHILAVGEAHAQKGTENIASSTRRFTEGFLPILAAPSFAATDVVVELWAPDPKCMKEVKAVASAQKPVTEVQAATNQNEYVTLGTKAKAAGMTPWLLRPTCDDFAMLADAGADAVGAMLGLVKRLTQEKLVQLHERNKRAALAEGGVGDPKTVVAYGGALHNDLAPAAAMKDYSFGPELDRLTAGRYVELDIIVPEFVKKSPTWEKLPWYPAFEAERAQLEKEGKKSDRATVYVVGERSFVLVFPDSVK
jgi:hypothetical protein